MSSGIHISQKKKKTQVTFCPKRDSVDDLVNMHLRHCGGRTWWQSDNSKQMFTSKPNQNYVDLSRPRNIVYSVITEVGEN